MPSGGSGKAPTAPTYSAPAPYSQPPAYQAPAAYQAPQDPNGVIPGVLNGQQVMQQGSQLEGMLPSWLQLNSDPMNPADRDNYEQAYYQKYLAPQIAQGRSDTYQAGQTSGSYGGAKDAQLVAQGQLDKYFAGLGYAQQLFGNQLQGRQSYYQGGPTVSATQNAADVSRGTNVAGLQSQNAANENNYNLQSANMQNNYNMTGNQGQNSYSLGSSQLQNGFAQNNYTNQLNAYQMQLQNQANRYAALAGGLGSIAGGAMSLAKPLFGGGGGSALAASPQAPTAYTPGPSLTSTYGMGGKLGQYGSNQIGGFGGTGFGALT